MYKPKTGWAVDGACQPNPGNASYQGKDLETGNQKEQRQIYLLIDPPAWHVAP